MKRLLVVIGSLVVAVAAAPREARADDTSEAIVTGLTVISVGTPTAIGFGIASLAISDPGRVYGAAEALVTLPQAAFYGWLAVGSDFDRDNRMFYGAYAVAHSALAVHGLYTLFKPRSRQSDAMRIVPTAVSDGRELGAGFGLVGTF
jgi:hypothetical protein